MPLLFSKKVAILGQAGSEKEFRDAGISFDKDHVLQLCKPGYSKDDVSVIKDVIDIKMEPGYVKVLNAEDMTFASYGYSADNIHGLRKGTTQGIPHMYTCILPSPLKKKFGNGDFDRSTKPNIIFFMIPQLDRKDNTYMNLEYVTASIVDPMTGVDLGNLLACHRESAEYLKVKQAVVEGLESMVVRSNNMMRSRMSSVQYVTPISFEGSGTRNNSTPYPRKQSEF